MRTINGGKKKVVSCIAARTHRALTVAILLGLAGLSACKTSESTSNDKAKKAIMANLVPYSVGRLSLLAPRLEQVFFTKAVLTDVSLERKPLGSPPDFAAWLSQRTTDIKQGKFSSGRQDALVKTYSLSPGLPAASLYWLYLKQDVLEVESYRTFGDSVLVGKTDAYPYELALGGKLVRGVLEAFTPLERGTAVSHGFAVDGGVIHWDFDNNEKLETTAKFSYATKPGDPPLSCKLDVITHVYSNAAPDTLPARMRQAEAGALLLAADSPGFSIKTLRSHARSVAGLKGDEGVTKGNDPKSHPGEALFSAEFEYGGDANNPVRPYLQITLTTGGQSPINTQAFLALWDTILDSASFHQ